MHLLGLFLPAVDADDAEDRKHSSEDVFGAVACRTRGTPGHIAPEFFATEASSGKVCGVPIEGALPSSCRFVTRLTALCHVDNECTRTHAHTHGNFPHAEIDSIPEIHIRHVHTMPLFYSQASTKLTIRRMVCACACAFCVMCRCGQAIVTQKVDVFSFGILLVELFTGELNWGERLPRDRHALSERLRALTLAGQVPRVPSATQVHSAGMHKLTR